MACGCKKRKKVSYVWTSEPNEDGATETVSYATEIQAKAKVIRAGGSYTTVG